MILKLHLICAHLFVFYILIDRIYVRNFILPNNRAPFYAWVKWPMAVLSLTLFFTGSLVLYEHFSSLVVLKAGIAVCLLGAFFYCPLYMKNECSMIKRMMYRYLVVILCAVTYGFGWYI